MDRNDWQLILRCIKRAARQLPRMRQCLFSDWLITAMFLWSVAHDRPMSWACDRVHYNGIFRPRRLPSVSWFIRRVKSERIRLILQRVHEELAGPLTATALGYFDGKPLPVGSASKDPDAAWGHVMNGFAKGYKLHAILTEDRRIPLFCVLPLNCHEVPAAQAMLEQAPLFSRRSLLLADGNYDAADLHKTVDRLDGRLLVKPRGMAEHPVTLRQMGHARRELLDTWRQYPSLCQLVYKQRIHVEGGFSNLTCYGGGLGPLPAWVRRLPRVVRWVGAKIILYHARLRRKKLDPM
jgi:hypothetical protein